MQKKVLSKLDIQLSAADMQKLAESQVGVIESVLFVLRERFDDLMNVQQQITQQPQQNQYSEEPAEETRKQPLKLPLKTKKCGQCECYEQDISVLNQEVAVLDEKVEKLQQLLRMKDEKIQKMAAKLKQLGYDV